MKTTNQKRMTAHVPVTVDVPLSPHWAFLVQFRAVPGGPARAAGRVEHLVSGRTRHFRSLKELSAYLTAELHTAENMTRE